MTQTDEWTITDEQRSDIVRQIGVINLMAISGSRVVAIADGVELPVGSGYSVRVHLTAGDDYTVERVFKRAGREWIKGQVYGVYFDTVSEVAYYASCFRSYDEGEWELKA